MTIDERAAACAEELLRQITRRGNVPFQTIIARHIREALTERDALLRECATALSDNNIAPSLVERITAMIGEQA